MEKLLIVLREPLAKVWGNGGRVLNGSKGGKSKGVGSHAVTGNQSSGFKSRAGNCSFTPLVLRSIM